MKRIFLLPLLTAGLGVFAQKNDASKFASVITGDALKSHLTIIAGDDMQGRETGTEGQRKAAAYIESQFKKMGLKSPEALKGYQQFYPLFQDSMISSKLSINGKELGFETDYIIPASSNDKQGFNSDEVVFVGYGIEDSLYNDYGDLDVKGKPLFSSWENLNLMANTLLREPIAPVNGHFPVFPANWHWLQEKAL